MKHPHARLAALAAGCCGLFGCSGNSNDFNSSTQRNLTEMDRAAINSAKPEPEIDIMPNTHLASGRLLEMQGAFRQAIEQYQLAIAGDPKNVGAMNRLAMVYSRLGRFDEALNSMQRAVEIKPDVALLRNNLGYIQLCKLNWTEAESEFREALRLDPEFARARVNLGMALARQDRIPEAHAEFRAVLPEADALYNLGLVLRGMKRYQEAVDAFELVLEKDPRFVAAEQQIKELEPRLREQRSHSRDHFAGAAPVANVAPVASLAADHGETGRLETQSAYTATPVSSTPHTAAPKSPSRSSQPAPAKAAAPAAVTSAPVVTPSASIAPAKAEPAHAIAVPVEPADQEFLDVESSRIEAAEPLPAAVPVETPPATKPAAKPAKKVNTSKPAAKPANKANSSKPAAKPAAKPQKFEVIEQAVPVDETPEARPVQKVEAASSAPTPIAQAVPVTEAASGTGNAVREYHIEAMTGTSAHAADVAAENGIKLEQRKPVRLASSKTEEAVAIDDVRATSRGNNDSSTRGSSSKSNSGDEVIESATPINPAQPVNGPQASAAKSRSRVIRVVDVLPIVDNELFAFTVNAPDTRSR